MTQSATRWVRRNLAARPMDTLLSLLVLPSLAWLAFNVLQWAVSLARWDVIADSIRVLMVGVYPVEETWRAWFSAGLLSAMFGAGAGVMLPLRGRTATYLAALFLSAAALMQFIDVAAGPYLLTCAWIWLGAWWTSSAFVRLRRLVAPAFLVGLGAIFVVYSRPGLETWGGLLLSVILTVTTSILTIPLGILLAFGRQSRILSVRICCTAYIEIMRSVPLILVVYWIWIIVPLLAPDASVPGLLRGMAGFALFFAAYVAEYVRSGFQALPKGQVEAARSLGMRTWTVNLDIVLPQALRVVVPALVGQVLDIFNGATLVFIIGLTDFLRAGQMILANPQHSSQVYEVYTFMFVLYFLIGSAITYASRRLEAHLGRGVR